MKKQENQPKQSCAKCRELMKAFSKLKAKTYPKTIWFRLALFWFLVKKDVPYYYIIWSRGTSPLVRKRNISSYLLEIAMLARLPSSGDSLRENLDSKRAPKLQQLISRSKTSPSRISQLSFIFGIRQVRRNTDPLSQLTLKVVMAPS